METEKVLYYSERFFGTADAISFRPYKGKDILRIHDLKTGKRPAHIEQLIIYAALFCLEYKKNPHEFETELRIYQNNEVLVHKPEPDEIINIMNIIIHVDEVLSKVERGV